MVDDRSLSGHRNASGASGNFVMPPRYPQASGQYHNGPTNYRREQHGGAPGFNSLYSPNSTQFPRGGTGDTGNDSFASSFKHAQYVGGGASFNNNNNPNNFSTNLALTTNSFQIGVDTSTANSVDYVASMDDRHRTGSFSNTATDWKPAKFGGGGGLRGDRHDSISNDDSSSATMQHYHHNHNRMQRQSSGSGGNHHHHHQHQHNHG